MSLGDGTTAPSCTIVERGAQHERFSYAFGGAFYAWPFHCGVAAYLQERRPLHPDARIFGTSSGSLAAALLACGVNVRGAGLRAANLSTDAHIGLLGPYLRPRAISRSLDLFLQVLPEDAYERVSGKLVLTVTQVPAMRVIQVSEFPSNEALAEALRGTMAVPGHSVHLAYRTRALKLGWVLDGGLRTRTLQDDRPEWRTVRVASFRPRDMPTAFRNAHIHPERRVGLRTRFLRGRNAHRHGWFEHGYQCARAHFEQRALPIQ